MGCKRNEYKILVGKPEGKNHSEDLGVDGTMDVYREINGKVWSEFIWLWIGTSDGLL
jgi:hypothetical protein